jgi:hypothetical protein
MSRVLFIESLRMEVVPRTDEIDLVSTIDRGALCRWCGALIDELA